MPLLSFFRFFASLLSLFVLAAAGWLLWSWYQGDLVRDAYGDVYRLRDDWRLWLGVGLLAWSFLGRFVMLALLTRRDERVTRAVRGHGHQITGETGSSLYVESHGPVEAPPIILTHGWGLDSTFWSYARRDLGDRFRLTAWDLPGLGRSKPAPHGGISLEAFAADLAGLVDSLGGRRVVLVGHSIGGMTIQTLIRDHPQIQTRLAGVVLLNTTYTNPLTTMIFSGLARALRHPVLEPAFKLTILLKPLMWAMQWQSYLSGSTHLGNRLGFGKAVTRSQLEHVSLLTTRNSPAAQARGNLAMFGWDATGALDHLYVPLLVIGGDKDIVTKLEAGRAIAAGSRTGRLEVIDANHLGPMEQAQAYNQLISDFVLQAQRNIPTDASPALPVLELQPYAIADERTPPSMP
jgi:pimeloyl-ACP methyl ester carboxylesterase